MYTIKRITNVSLLILVLGLGLSSCYKKNFKDHAGPSICPSDDFAYSEQPNINDATINLNVDTLKIRAAFNEETSWSIKIKGLTSKSFKEYSGYGDKIVIDWQGNPDTVVFFKAESCELEVKIACLTESIILPFTITNVNSFAKFNYLAYNADLGAFGMGPYVYGTYATHGVEAGLNSPQGGNCFCITGSSPSPTWYFGGLDIDVAALPYTLADAVGTNPDEVYFNCFINVRGQKGAVPAVNFKEGNVIRSKFIYPEGDTLWHYVSFKLSEANVINPRDITVVGFGLNAYPEQGTSGKLCFDFVNFTNKEPFIKTSEK